MTLKELKLSLQKFPPDMDDMQVLLVYAQDGKMQLECVAFTGYIPQPGVECIAVGGTSEIQRRVKSGEIEPPDGYNEIFGGSDNDE